MKWALSCKYDTLLTQLTTVTQAVDLGCEARILVDDDVLPCLTGGGAPVCVHRLVYLPSKFGM
jgi:hypothetical protein